MSCKVDPGTSQLFGPQWKLGSFTVIMCHLCYPTSNYPGNTLNFPVGTVYLMINASAVGGDLPHDLGLTPYAHPIPQDTVQTRARSMRYAGENTLPFPPWTGNKETSPLCLLFEFIIVYIGFYSQLYYVFSIVLNTSLTLPSPSFFIQLFLILKTQFMSPSELACHNLARASSLQVLNLCFCCP